MVQGRGKIDLGSKIRARANNKEKNFELVSFNEADPLNGKISNESPLGLAFLGKKKGEEALVQTPRGVVKYKIIDVK